MATYNLQLDDVEARVDGNVKFDMWVLTADAAKTPLHKDVLVPYTDIEAALALPTTGAKVTAIKAAIWDNRNNRTPVVENTTEWEIALLQATIGSINEMTALREFITVTLALSFPFQFTISG